MKLYIKQRVFTLGERFYVKDEFGNDCYYVEGSFFRIPKRFEIYDMNENLMASIDKQIFRFLPHYDITVNHKTYTLKKDFTLFFQRFSLTNTNWVIEGNFTAHQYQIIRGNKPVMSITKHWFTWGDSYELTIENKDDAVLCLGIVIAIDAAIDSQTSRTIHSNN